MRTGHRLVLLFAVVMIASVLLVDLPGPAANPSNVMPSVPSAIPPPAATIDAAKGSAAPQAPGRRPADALPSVARTVQRPVLDFGLAVHRITVPHDEPFLPPGPGREQFVANCVICHSPRYVTNQEFYSRRTWAAEVKKMAALYGAPIAPQQIKAITDYLVSFHGKEDPRP